jgi:hypothetical protein
MDEDFDSKLARVLAARDRQEARHAHGVMTLLHGRDDLRGVHALADMVGERVLWCA